MRRRLLYAWGLISVLWIGYGVWNAVFYWTRWGSFVSPDRQLSVFAVTAYEILVFPVMLGLLLGGVIALHWAVRRTLGRA